MKLNAQLKIISAISALGFLGGCGTYVPELQEFYETPDQGRTMVQVIVHQVQCEVHNAILSVILEDMDRALDPQIVEVEKKTGKKPGRTLDWLDNWAAQVTLTLTIDEKSNLNPGVMFNTPMIGATTYFAGSNAKYPVSVASSQSYNLGLGGQFSADATRKETLAIFIDPNKFVGPTPAVLAKQFSAGSLTSGKIHSLQGTLAGPCHNEYGIFIESDLKLKEWLEDVALPAAVKGGTDPGYGEALVAEAKAAKKDVVSHEVTFVIVYGGNITPTWKLVRVSANTGSPFFGATRTKTQDLIITMGPPQGGGLSVTASNTILAAQIGQAVASAIRNTQ